MSGLLPVEQGDREQDARNLIAFQKTYKSKKIFQQLDFPLACSKSGNAFCCRVRWNGQHLAGKSHPLYNPPENGGIMSALLCFPAVSSLLTSIKDRYTDKNDDRGLDLIFQGKYRQVQMRYVADGKMMAQAHSDLSRLQKLIDDGILPINHDAFDCILYQRGLEWFATAELPLILAPYEDGSKVAGEIVEFVINTIVEFHSVDTEKHFWGKVASVNYINYREQENYKVWHALLGMMGSFRTQLLFAYFSIGKDSVTHCGDSEDDSDANLKDLALLYPDLPGLVRKVLIKNRPGHLGNRGRTTDRGVAEVCRFYEVSSPR